MCTVPLLPGVNPTAVDKYININISANPNAAVTMDPDIEFRSEQRLVLLYYDPILETDKYKISYSVKDTFTIGGLVPSCNNLE
jgi:hypothetical protein